VRHTPHRNKVKDQPSQPDDFERRWRNYWNGERSKLLAPDLGVLARGKRILMTETRICMWGPSPQCTKPATKMVTVHEKYDERVVDLDVCVCDEHYKALANSERAEDYDF
jgi:hypothetical protein